QDRTMTMRLDIEDGIELVGSVTDIHSIARFHSLWNPEKAVDPHHMIDPQNSCQPQIMSNVSPNIAVTLLPDPFRMERTKSPALAPGEERVRRSTGREPPRKRIAPSPDIETVGIHAQRQIDIKAQTALP